MKKKRFRREDDQRPGTVLGIWLAVGVTMGILLGYALHYLALGIAIGAIAGITLGLYIDSRNQTRDEEDSLSRYRNNRLILIAGVLALIAFLIILALLLLKNR